MMNQMATAMLDLESRGIDTIAITLHGDGQKYIRYERHSLPSMSPQKRDELILQVAARMSPVFAPFLGEALLRLRSGYRDGEELSGAMEDA